MLDFVRYIPVTGKVVAPYIRTAIGINIWDENYTDLSGNKINYTSSPSDLAYQISLGANFYIVKNTGLFIEAGYGKYILNAGLAFKL
jgi:outer membrane protease